MADNRKINRFEDSVSEFSHKNVNGSIKEDKRKMLPGLIARSILIAICIGIFGYAVFMIASSALETDEVNDLYDSIRPQNLSSAVKPSTPLLEPTPLYTLQEFIDANGDYKDYIGDIDSVEDQNRRSSYYRNYLTFLSNHQDAYAWIYVDNTKIDYPVMKGPYTNYYLSHDFNGKESSSGSITAETNLSDNFDTNMNTLIYGHCMKNGSMFRTLKTFMESANRNTLAKSMNIEIYTEDGLYIYKVLSGYRDDGNFFAQTLFLNTENYLEFLNKVVSHNTLRVSQKYDANSKICTLVTCANVTSNEDERYVMHGILTAFIPASQL